MPSSCVTHSSLGSTIGVALVGSYTSLSEVLGVIRFSFGDSALVSVDPSHFSTS